MHGNSMASPKCRVAQRYCCKQPFDETVQYMHGREYSTVLCSAPGRLRFMLAVHEDATRVQPLVTLWLFYVQ